MAPSDVEHVASTAYRQLRAGDLLQDGYEELLDICTRVAHSGRARPIIRELGFADDAAPSLVGELFVANRMASILQRSTDAESFTRLVYRAASNALINLYRRTQPGQFGKRCAAILRQDPQFESSSQGWHLASTRDGIWDQDVNRLIAAVWRIDVPRPTDWTGDRAAPIAYREDIVTLMVGILTEAGGPVRLSQLLYVMRHRFMLLETTTLADSDALLPAFEPTVEDQAVTALTADRIYEGLDHRERLILGTLNLPVRELGQLLGCGKTKAHEDKTLAVTALNLLADDDSMAEAVIDRCVEYADNTLTWGVP